MKNTKKGFISIEYIIVAGIILTSAAFLLIAQPSTRTESINNRINDIINIDMMP